MIADRLLKLFEHFQVMQCLFQVNSRSNEVNQPAISEVERSLKTFTERSTELEEWLKTTEKSVIEVSGLLNSEFLKKEKVHVSKQTPIGESHFFA